MRLILFFLLLSPICASAQILRAYGVTVTIRNDKIGNKRITWYSQDVFEYNKEIFFRRGKRWVSEKSTLIVAQ